MHGHHYGIAGTFFVLFALAGVSLIVTLVAGCASRAERNRPERNRPEGK